MPLEALGLQRARPELDRDAYVEIAYRTPPPFISLLLYTQWDLSLWTCLGKSKEPPDSGAGPLVLGRLPGCLRRLFLRLAGFVGLSRESQCSPVAPERLSVYVAGDQQGTSAYRLLCLFPLAHPCALDPSFLWEQHTLDKVALRGQMDVDRSFL